MDIKSFHQSGGVHFWLSPKMKVDLIELLADREPNIILDDSTVIFLKKNVMFIFEREKQRQRQCVSRVEAERERGRHRIQNRLQAPAVSTESDTGFELRNSEIMT